MPRIRHESTHKSYSAPLLLALLYLYVAPLTTTSAIAAGPKPNLVVRAKTDFSDQGWPTLDLLDLERFFVKQLTARNVENVVPFATAKIPHPAAREVYLLELSVDTLQPGYGARRNPKNGHYEAVLLFHVEHSLTVRHLASGRLLGKSGERREYHLSAYEIENSIASKREAIYDCAKRLASRFLSEAENGKFGTEIATLDPTVDWESLKEHPAAPYIAFVLIILGFFPLAVIAGTIDASRQAQARQQLADTRCEKRLHEAKARAIDTNNFSPDWYRSAARTAYRDILPQGAAILQREADRQIHIREVEAEYRQIAAYAASRHGLKVDEVVDMLSNADAHDYRLFEFAKKVIEEGS